MEKGFFGSLFDFDFESLVATRVIRILFALAVVVYTLGAVFLIIGSVSTGKPRGIFFAVIVVPLGYFIYLVLTRVWMEFVIVVLRMSDDIHAIRMGGGGFGPRGAVPNAPAPAGPSPVGPLPTGLPRGPVPGPPSAGGPPPTPGPLGGGVPPRPGQWPPR